MRPSIPSYQGVLQCPQNEDDFDKPSVKYIQDTQLAFSLIYCVVIEKEPSTVIASKSKLNNKNAAQLWC